MPTSKTGFVLGCAGAVEMAEVDLLLLIPSSNCVEYTVFFQNAFLGKFGGALVE